MRSEGLQPDLILCSTAARARETIDLASEAADFHGEIEYREDLYAFEPGAFLHALKSLPDHYDQVMLVGHNPAMDELVTGFTGNYHPMSTAALAHIDLPIEHWSEISFGIRARLVNLWRPKDN